MKAVAAFPWWMWFVVWMIDALVILLVAGIVVAAFAALISIYTLIWLAGAAGLGVGRRYGKTTRHPPPYWQAYGRVIRRMQADRLRKRAAAR